jgi:hypothetical protein
LVRGVEPQHGNAPGIRDQKSTEQAQQRRLSRAVRADQPGNLSSFDSRGHVF